MPVFTVPIDESNDCHTPAGSPAGGQFCTTGPGPGWYPRMVRHHDDALARLKALVPKASIALEERRDVPSAVAIRAAIVVADVLEKMKAQGYEMPDRIDVQLTKHRAPHGAVRGIRITDVGGGGETNEKHLSVDLPDTLPDDADLDDAVVAAFGEEVSAEGDPLYAGGYKYHRFTAETLKDIVVHEMGHVQAGHRGGELNMAPMLSSNLFPSTAAIQRAMKRVSIYASTSEDEFLAEAFTRLYRGETLADDSMKLYRALRGPKVR